MTYYSNPSHESDPHTLPDIELWRSPLVEFECVCGETWGACQNVGGTVMECEACGTSVSGDVVDAPAVPFWGWYCFPGCMPECSARGPFSSEEEALEALRN